MGNYWPTRRSFNSTNKSAKIWVNLNRFWTLNVRMNKTTRLNEIMCLLSERNIYVINHLGKHICSARIHHQTYFVTEQFCTNRFFVQCWWPSLWSVWKLYGMQLKMSTIKSTFYGIHTLCNKEMWRNYKCIVQQFTVNVTWRMRHKHWKSLELCKYQLGYYYTKLW